LRNSAIYVGKKWQYYDKIFPFNFWHFGEISHPIKTLVGLTTYLVVGLFCFIAEKLEHLIFHLELG
jgi:hypothetical protein